MSSPRPRYLLKICFPALCRMIPVLQDTPGLGQETVGTGGMHCPVTLGTGTGQGILCKRTQQGHNVTHRQHQLSLETRATSLFPARVAKVVFSSSILGKSQFPRQTKPNPSSPRLFPVQHSLHTLWARLGILLPTDGTSTRLCCTSQTCSQLSEAGLENSPLGAGKKQRRSSY